MLLATAAALGAVLSLSACARQQLVGKTTDVFGHPVASVDIKIEKTGFHAVSDPAGDYALDYAPGSFALVFSKPGFTTMHLDLNIAQLTRMPVETMVLYPVPKQAGVYVVGANELIRLTPAAMRRTTQRNTFGGQLRVTVPVGSTVTVPSGAMRFIDTYPHPLLLATPDRSGLFYEAAFLFLAANVKIHRFKDTPVIQVGDEKLEVRSVTLAPGPYAFVEMNSNELQGAQPGRFCFPFEVVAPGASPVAAKR